MSQLRKVDKLTRVVEQVTEQMEQLQGTLMLILEGILVGNAGSAHSEVIWHVIAPKPIPHSRESSNLWRHGPNAGG